MIFLCLSKNWYSEVDEACLCGYLCVASLLRCICSLNPRVLFSGVGSAAERNFQFLEGQVYSVAKLCPDQTFLSLCHPHHVGALCIFYKVNSNSNH